MAKNFVTECAQSIIKESKKMNKPFRLKGEKKKFGVYVTNPRGGEPLLVKFGDPNMEIKRDDPDRLKAFRDRHSCDSKNDKTKPGYWSCKMWEKGKSVSDVLAEKKILK